MDTNEKTREGLVAAIAENDLAQAEFLLAAQAEENAEDWDASTVVCKPTRHGQVALLEAVRAGLKEFIELFLTYRVDVNCQDSKETCPPLLVAASMGETDMAAMLVQGGADVDFAGPDNATALILAADNDRRDTVRLLLQHGASVDRQDKYGGGALFLASQGGHTEIVEELIRAGASVDMVTSDGVSSLFAASSGGHHGVVCALLSAGADVHLMSPEGFSALWLASQNGHDRVVKRLLNAGADANNTDRAGWSCLLKACYKGHRAVVRALLKAKAAVNSQEDAMGWAPLHAAAQIGARDIVSDLLLAAADAEIRSKDGWTPLHCASTFGQTDVIKLLLEYGADTTAQDASLKTPEYLAQVCEQENAVALLTEGLNMVRVDHYEAALLRLFNEVSGDMAEDWIFLARELKFVKPKLMEKKIKDILQEFPRSKKEQAFQSLLQWKLYHGKDATAWALARCLHRCRHKYVSQKKVLSEAEELISRAEQLVVSGEMDIRQALSFSRKFESLVVEFKGNLEKRYKLYRDIHQFYVLLAKSIIFGCCVLDELPIWGYTVYAVVIGICEQYIVICINTDTMGAT
ncbi:ankyrin-1-like [Lingula anatina]|uniref:Ankyrin-1-like n=1 Tax=Lingula anatina TaxID=7574 RepID=A0A1S3K6P5_LINAN|nr:ankyrin-1-like [Lingula anatina]|eukprot:XP_013417926.1 ankyrin-1-like [Lingula anatina]